MSRRFKDCTALTFDDGPCAMTERLLDLLDGRGATATFFVVGKRASSASAVISRMASQGHEVGVHTWSHPHLNGLDDDRFRSELGRCKSCIEDYSNVTPRLFRPPYGFISERQRSIARDEFDLSTVLWNIDTFDWRSQNSLETAATVLKSLKSGNIILLHDTHQSTIRAVETVLSTPAVQADRFISVSELRKLYSLKSF